MFFHKQPPRWTKIILFVVVAVAFAVVILDIIIIRRLPSTLPSSSSSSNKIIQPLPAVIPTFDTAARPKYVKKLPPTVNPAIFAEAEKRLVNCEFLYNKTAGPLFLAQHRGEWKYDIRGENRMIVELIRCGVPFTFTRQSDGEYYIIKGLVIGKNSQAKKLDKWEYKGGQSKLSGALASAIADLPLNNGIIIQGFVCPGEYRHILDYEVNATLQDTRFIMSTYVFAGCNYGLTADFMENVVLAGKLKQQVIVITNKDCMAREQIIRKWALEVYYLPDEFPLYWEDHGDMIMSTFASIARAYTGVLFLISGGPGTPPIQIAMSRANPWNQYISMGSAIERWTKGFNSRGAEPSEVNPTCHLDPDQCIFRKHPITGQTETIEEYLADNKKWGLDDVNILD